MGSDGARVVYEAYLTGLISMETFLQTLSDMELISIGSAADEMARIAKDTFIPKPRVQSPADATSDNRTVSAIEKGDEK
jgi:hypothetical protein